MSALGAFAAGAWFGMCLTLLVTLALLRALQDDDNDDDWNPWGK